jgi:peroxiredoxin
MANEKHPTTLATKWRGYVINLMMFIVLVVGIRTWQQRDMMSGMALPLQGTTLARLPYELPSKPSKPMLVHFWATWCSICRAEQSTIASVAHDYPDNIITIAMQSGSQDSVMNYMKDQNLTFPVLNDANGSLSKSWGVHAVPASFIINPDGKISFVEVGYTTSIGLRLRLWLAGI